MAIFRPFFEGSHALSLKKIKPVFRRFDFHGGESLLPCRDTISNSLLFEDEHSFIDRVSISRNYLYESYDIFRRGTFD